WPGTAGSDSGSWPTRTSQSSARPKLIGGPPSHRKATSSNRSSVTTAAQASCGTPNAATDTDPNAIWPLHTSAKIGSTGMREAQRWVLAKCDRSATERSAQDPQKPANAEPRPRPEGDR